MFTNNKELVFKLLLKQRKLKVILLVFLLLSCTKEIPLEIEIEKPSLVVNCIFNPNTPFTFYLSTTSSITSSSLPSDDTLFVKIYQDDKLILETTSVIDTLKTTIYPKIGSIYYLEIESENYGTLTASDSIPKLPETIDGKFYYFTGVDDYGEYCAEAQVNFDNSETYYEILIMNYYGGYWDWSPDYNITDPVILNEGIIDYYPRSIFFSNEIIKDLSYTIKLPHCGYSKYSSSIGEDMYCIFRSISKNYYLYLRYLLFHLSNQQIASEVQDILFIGEPQNMYSNIENGYGIFAGYSEQIKKLTNVNLNSN